MTVRRLSAVLDSDSTCRRFCNSSPIRLSTKPEFRRLLLHLLTSAGGTTYKDRARDQSQNRQRARHRATADAAGPRRQSDRITWLQQGRMFAAPAHVGSCALPGNTCEPALLPLTDVVRTQCAIVL